MKIFNVFGLICIIAILMPNIFYPISKKKNKKYNASIDDVLTKAYHNKVLEIIENIGRYGCMLFMIINIPFVCFGFKNDMAELLYYVLTATFSFLYVRAWIAFWDKHFLFRAYFLSILPTIIFLYAGIMYLNIPLIVFSIIFGIGHITISVKNAYMVVKE